MFDLTSSKLLILGIVALIVVGPKELPFLLRTIGKYVGMIRRQANEFRAQFDEAMREAELDSIKKDLEAVARDTENTIKSAQSSFEHDINTTTRELDQSMQRTESTAAAEPTHTFDALNGLDAPPLHGSTSPSSLTVDATLPTPPPEAATEFAAVTPPVPAPESDALPVPGIGVRQAPELAKTGT